MKFPLREIYCWPRSTTMVRHSRAYQRQRRRRALSKIEADARSANEPGSGTMSSAGRRVALPLEIGKADAETPSGGAEIVSLIQLAKEETRVAPLISP